MSTPGQQARELIREARVVLDDPTKVEYHERLSTAADKLQAELDFWAWLGALMQVVDIANET